jgi:hypothetical protein
MFLHIDSRLDSMKSNPARIIHEASAAAADPGMPAAVLNYAEHNLGALDRVPRRTVEYACAAPGRAPCLHAHLLRLAINLHE